MGTPNQTLIELIEARRIALTPEHGAGWCAEVYGDEAEVQYTGYGLTVDEAITAALSPSTQADPQTNLIAFWVGDMDIYAALSPEQALALCVEHSGMPDTYDLDDVYPACIKTLDLPMVEEGGEPCGTLRELLAKTTEPGWMAGFE